MLFWVEAAQRSIESHRRDARAQSADASAAALERRLQTIEATAPRAWPSAMEFGFLLDPERQLLSIGYLVAEDSARSQLLRPARLGGPARQLRGDRQGRRAGPPLVPARPRGDAGRARRGADLVVGIDVRVSDAVAGHARAGRQPDRADQPTSIVRRQIDYGAGLGVPWGISESAYNARDKELTYQYSNFGVPGLGFKRGLSENVVIAPYATALAAMVDPAAAARNFARLAEIGGRGRYGFYEALDFTPSRLPEGEDVGRRARLHGAPPGHDGGRHRQRAARRRDAHALPRRADHPGDRAAAAGAHAARRRGRPSARRGGQDAAPRCDDLEPAVVRRLHTPHARQPADAPAVERPLRGDADRGGLGLQPLGRSRRHALARGHDARRLGQLHLPARRRERRGLVGGLPAARRRGRTATT